MEHEEEEEDQSVGGGGWGANIISKTWGNGLRSGFRQGGPAGSTKRGERVCTRRQGTEGQSRRNPGSPVILYHFPEEGKVAGMKKQEGGAMRKKPGVLGVGRGTARRAYRLQAILTARKKMGEDTKMEARGSQNRAEGTQTG